MKIAAGIARSLHADMQAELRGIERAVPSGTRGAGRSLRTELLRQVSSAGLGQRLANSWRDRHYANWKLYAASLASTRPGQAHTPLLRPSRQLQRGRADFGSTCASACSRTVSGRPTTTTWTASGGLEGFGRRGRPHQLPLFFDWRRRSLPYWAGISPLGALHGGVNSTSSTRSPDSRSRSRIRPTPGA